MMLAAERETTAAEPDITAQKLKFSAVNRVWLRKV